MTGVFALQALIAAGVAAWSLQQYIDESAGRMAPDPSTWPGDLARMEGAKLDDFHTLVAERVTNVVAAEAEGCAADVAEAEFPHCRGDAALPLCSNASDACANLRSLAEFQADTLQAVERRVGQRDGIFSMAFARALRRLVEAALRAACGSPQATASLRLKVFLTDTAGWYAKADPRVLTGPQLLGAPMQFGYHTARALPWLIHAFSEHTAPTAALALSGGAVFVFVLVLQSIFTYLALVVACAYISGGVAV